MVVEMLLLNVKVVRVQGGDERGLSKKHSKLGEDGIVSKAIRINYEQLFLTFADM